MEFLNSNENKVNENNENVFKMEFTIYFLSFDFCFDFCYYFTLFFFTYNLDLLYTFLNSYNSKIRKTVQNYFLIYI